jgi:hypothetical protein
MPAHTVSDSVSFQLSDEQLLSLTRVFCFTRPDEAFNSRN